ncbi:hypothetical protein V2G26_001124 [Clonostachys chloroleuca]
MSCRQAFDLAWSCNSLGGQWNAVYRHGEMRSCSDHWDDFWFCMRTKSHTGQAKADAVRQHYRNKEHAKYYAPGRHSSEDVWESRPERLPPAWPSRRDSIPMSTMTSGGSRRVNGGIRSERTWDLPIHQHRMGGCCQTQIC